MSFSALSQRAVRADRLALMPSTRQTSRSRWTSRDWSVAVKTSSMANCLSSLKAGTYLVDFTEKGGAEGKRGGKQWTIM